MILLFGTNLAQHYLVSKPREEQLTAQYLQQIAILQAKIKSIGPMVSIWTVKEGPQALQAGQAIRLDDLEMNELPESLVTQSLILDPTPVIGKYYRVGLSAGTPLTWDVVMDDPIDDTTRDYDIVANMMPIGLKPGDYIDFRIVYPLGEDFIVLPHKRVEAINGKTFKLKLNETEIHFYQATLVDYFLQVDRGAMLYLTKYVEPGTQKAASPYYAVPKNILAIMEADPNIAKKINARLNDDFRSHVESAVNGVSDEAGQAVLSGRSQMMSEIDSGQSEYRNESGKQEDARQQVQDQIDLGTPGPSSAPQTDSSVSASPSPAIPTSIFEEGVVE